MKTVCRAKPAWMAAGLRFILLGLITLLLLTTPARGQSGWSPEDLGKKPDGVKISGWHQSHPPVAGHPASGLHQDLAVRPSGSGWPPSRCPLPPASAFALQANLRKYLETWPTPGSTTNEDWPEYVPEDGEGLD